MKLRAAMQMNDSSSSRTWHHELQTPPPFNLSFQKKEENKEQKKNGALGNGKYPLWIFYCQFISIFLFFRLDIL